MSLPNAPELPPAVSQPDWQMAVARGLNREAERLIGPNPALARQRLDDATRIAREIGANNVLAMSLLLRARLHYAEAQFDDALRVCNEAAIIAVCDGDVAVQAQTLSGLSAIWASLGLGAEALPHLEAAAEFLTDTEDAAGLALVRSLLGGVEAQLGRSEAGLRQFELALAGFRTLGLRDRVVETRHNIACVYNLDKRFSEALALSMQNAVEAKRYGNITLLAHIDATSVEAFCGLGRFDEAVAHARAALSQARAGSRGELDVMLWLGIALDKAGSADEAFNVLRDTLQKSEAAGMPANGALLSALVGICRKMDNAIQANQYEGIIGQGTHEEQTHVTRLRLKALEASVELQGTRLRFGHAEADRARLKAQLETNERLLDARGAPDQIRHSVLLPETAAAPIGFDHLFDGAACGFRLAYQPIVDLSVGNVTGFKVLLRWNHPMRGNMLPLEFVSHLETSGEITTIGHWVLRQACEDLALLQRETSRALRVSIDVSPRELERAGYAAEMIKVVQEANLAPCAVELDLTDGGTLPVHAQALQQLRQLRGDGLRFAMNYHGSAFTDTAVALLSRIKIERRSVSGISCDERQAANLRAIVQAVRMPLFAHGIEGAHQLAALRALGCEDGFGFAFSAAVPLDIARLLVNRNFVDFPCCRSPQAELA
ncbi:MAG: EAL domain-containing protein [Betaproteobacteria bacterium]|nr:EAL domain-containing protein [Betaproteobacteria bacterium]